MLSAPTCAWTTECDWDYDDKTSLAFAGKQSRQKVKISWQVIKYRKKLATGCIMKGAKNAFDVSDYQPVGDVVMTSC